MSAPAIYLTGATASGKSALALDIALEFDGSIINADSMQVYRELRILSARPTAEEEEMGLDKAEIGLEAYPEFAN